jgi:cytochrome c biogenesis protein CcdA
MAIVFSLVLGILSAVGSACCTLPLIGAVAGVSMTRSSDRRTALWSTLQFMTGVIIALLAIGWLFVFFGQAIIKISGDYWKIAAGCMTLLFGIGALRLFPFTFPKLKFSFGNAHAAAIVSGFSGMIFGGTIAVTSLPCNPGIFIILGAAVLEQHLVWAFSNLTAYAIGFSLPLSALVYGLSLGKGAARLQKAEKVIRIAAGILLIAISFYLFSSF